MNEERETKKVFGSRSPCFVVANVLDSDIFVNEFELQPRYYLHFHYNTLGKYMKPHK